jgi:hypothetical protein
MRKFPSAHYIRYLPVEQLRKSSAERRPLKNGSPAVSRTTRR